jgi:hypothetical protein
MLAGCRGKIHMCKTSLFAAAVAALVLIGIGTWFGVRTFTATGALAGSADKPPAMMTGAKGPPTSHYDDFEIVVH